jgi:hypothetical protein
VTSLMSWHSRWLFDFAAFARYPQVYELAILS